MKVISPAVSMNNYKDDIETAAFRRRVIPRAGLGHTAMITRFSTYCVVYCAFNNTCLANWHPSSSYTVN